MKNLKLLKQKGYPTFSKKQNLNEADLFYSYSNNKIKNIDCLSDIKRTIRIYELSVKGEITKTFIKEILNYMENRLMLTIFIIGNQAYYLTKIRKDRGKFKKIYNKINKNNIPKYQENVHNLIEQFNYIT